MKKETQALFENLKEVNSATIRKGLEVDFHSQTFQTGTGLGHHLDVGFVIH